MSNFDFFRAGWEASAEGHNHEYNNLLADGYEDRGYEEQLTLELRRMFERTCVQPKYRYDPPRNGDGTARRRC